MAFNWEIKVANPILSDGMSFRVRYKKQNGNWLDFLPNPTTNIFTITGLEEEKYTAEIKTVCSDGTLSTPGYIESPCYNSGGGDNGIPPVVNIYWNDMTAITEREYNGMNFNFPIGYIASDADNDIVLVELESSSNNVNWNKLSVISTQVFQVTGSKPSDYYFRVRVTDSRNNTSVSNVISVKFKEVIIPDVIIDNIINLESICSTSGAGERLSFDVNGSPNQIVKFQVVCLDVVGHNFNFNITTENSNTSVFSWGSASVGAKKEGAISLNSNGKLNCIGEFCLRPCLNETYSQASISLTLFNDDGDTLSNQVISFSGYQECNI